MNVKKMIGLAAVAGLMFVATPAQQASAMSLSSPGVAAAVQQGGQESLTTQVQYRRRGVVVRRGYGWHRPYYARRHYGWNRPYYRRHWR